MTRRTFVPAGPRGLRASGDRWLFGYADLVTLLFACFAALYVAPPAPAASPARSSAAPPAIVGEVERLARTENQIHLDVTARAGETVISLAEAGSFAPGRADLTPAALRVMRGLSDALRRQPSGIRVEGHTDDLPIRTSTYDSNWELSTARATRVVQFLVEQGGLAPARLSAAGYGEYRPKRPNTGPDARAANRRVDIVVLDSAPVQGDLDHADYTFVRTRVSDRR